MDETAFKKMFARNLTYYINASGKTQAEVAKALHLNKATLSSWCTGTRTPRMDKVDLLCEYFKIRRSDLMEEHSRSSSANSAIRMDVTSDEADLINSYRRLTDEGKTMVRGMLHAARQSVAQEKVRQPESSRSQDAG